MRRIILNLAVSPDGFIEGPGGGELIPALLNAGLINEMQLAVHPVILGSGKPLFGGLPGRIKLKTVDCIKYDSGLVQIFYECG